MKNLDDKINLFVDKLTAHIEQVINDNSHNDDSWTGDFGSFHTTKELKQAIRELFHAENEREI